MQLGGSPDLEEDLAVEAVGSRPALAVLLLYVRLLHLFAFDLLDPYHPGFQNQKQRLFDVRLADRDLTFVLRGHQLDDPVDRAGWQILQIFVRDMWDGCRDNVDL
jgi:hypothetical protein